MNFYHYVHCPFCVRVRFALGYLGQKYNSIVLPYNDEATPIKLTGVKMLPIMEFEDGPINESLEIIQRLDENNRLNFAHYNTNQEEIENLLTRVGKDVHNLAMPYWIWTAEFDNDSRVYFQQKKEKKRGPFKNLIQNKQTNIDNLNVTLAELENILSPYYKSDELTITDILIASHLWGMFIVPEFQFSSKVYNYLMDIKNKCNFDYHKDFWRKE